MKNCIDAFLWWVCGCLVSEDSPIRFFLEDAVYEDIDYHFWKCLAPEKQDRTPWRAVNMFNSFRLPHETIQNYLERDPLDDIPF